MTICDASALIALINAGDRNHQRCKTYLSQLDAPLITTWSCFTEGMHMLGLYGGWQAQQVLWNYLIDGLLTIHSHTKSEQTRMAQLMKQYSDVPMDLGDALLVVLAETLSQNVVFTLDRDFYIYRLPGNQGFQVIPPIGSN